MILALPLRYFGKKEDISNAEISKSHHCAYIFSPCIGRTLCIVMHVWHESGMVCPIFLINHRYPNAGYRNFAISRSSVKGFWLSNDPCKISSVHLKLLCTHSGLAPHIGGWCQKQWAEMLCLSLCVLFLRRERRWMSPSTEGSAQMAVAVVCVHSFPYVAVYT